MNDTEERDCPEFEQGSEEDEQIPLRKSFQMQVTFMDKKTHSKIEEDKGDCNFPR